MFGKLVFSLLAKFLNLLPYFFRPFYKLSAAYNLRFLFSSAKFTISAQIKKKSLKKLNKQLQLDNILPLF